MIIALLPKLKLKTSKKILGDLHNNISMKTLKCPKFILNQLLELLNIK